jgi:PBP1b-binding outer membrane lipoprotein LpoB
MAKSAAEMKRFINDEQQALDLPDFSLSGKLLEQRASDGRERQVTYTFQLSLTQLSTGYAIWEDEVNIQKIGRKSNLSW